MDETSRAYEWLVTVLGQLEEQVRDNKYQDIAQNLAVSIRASYCSDT